MTRLPERSNQGDYGNVGIQANDWEGNLQHPTGLYRVCIYIYWETGKFKGKYYLGFRNYRFAGLWLAGNEGMEKKMETTIMGSRMDFIGVRA